LGKTTFVFRNFPAVEAKDLSEFMRPDGRLQPGDHTRTSPTHSDKVLKQ
jgi:hypothetical protein